MTNWFEEEVRQLERRPLPSDMRNLILFYGSSTFTLWHDIHASFPTYNVLNRGFGGSTFADCLEFFDRLVIPVQPRVIVLYAGDNDLDQGTRPEQIIRYLETFIDWKRKALGAIPMAYVSVKLSVARLHIMHKIAYTNAIVEKYVADLPDNDDVDFVNTFRRMVGRGMAPFRGYYSHDDLHMNEHGYRVWGSTLSDYLTTIDQKIGGLNVRPFIGDRAVA